MIDKNENDFEQIDIQKDIKPDGQIIDTGATNPAGEARILEETPIDQPAVESSTLIGEEKKSSPNTDTLTLTDVSRDDYWDIPDFAESGISKLLRDGSWDYEPDQVVKLLADMNGGNAQTQYGVKDGQPVFQAIDSDGNVMDFDKIMTSIDKYAKFLRDAGDEGKAQSFSDVLSEPIAYHIAGIVDPIRDEKQVIGATRKSFIENGAMSDGDVQEMGDPNTVEVGTPIDLTPYKTQFEWIGVARTGDKPIPKMNVMSSVLASIADTPEFKDAGPKKKDKIMRAAYRGALDIMDNVDQKNVMMSTSDVQSAATQTAEKLVGNAIKVETYRPLTMSEHTRLDKDIRKTSLTVKENSFKMGEYKNAADASADIAKQMLESLGINANAIQEEKASGYTRDTSTVMIDKIGRISDLPTRAKALKAYMDYRAGVSGYHSVKSENKDLVTELDNLNDLVDHGYPIDGQAKIDFYKNAAPATLARYAGDPTFRRQVNESFMMTDGTEEEAIKASQMMVVNNTFNSHNISALPKGIQLSALNDYSKYAAAVKAGRLEEMPGGIRMADIAKNMEQKIRKEQADKVYSTIIPNLRANLGARNPIITVGDPKTGGIVNITINKEKDAIRARDIMIDAIPKGNAIGRIAVKGEWDKYIAKEFGAPAIMDKLASRVTTGHSNTGISQSDQDRLNELWSTP